MILHDKVNWVCYAYNIKGTHTTVHVYDPVVNGDFPAIAVANHHRKAYDLFLALGHCMSIVLGATIPSALGFNIIKHTGGPGARLALTNIES